jgi:DNA-binding MarR family transcriptional regulator
MTTRLSAAEIGAACVCLGLRKAARAVSRRYDRALRPLGLTSGQFGIGAALLRDQAVPLGDLAQALGMDRTTLNHNLKPLIKRGLVRDIPNPEDRRVRALQLTREGRAVMRKAIPLWQQAQADAAARLGATAWSDLARTLGALG